MKFWYTHLVISPQNKAMLSEYMVHIQEKTILISKTCYALSRLLQQCWFNEWNIAYITPTFKQYIFRIVWLLKIRWINCESKAEDDKSARNSKCFRNFGKISSQWFSVWRKLKFQFSKIIKFKSMKTSFLTIWKKINLFIFQSVFMWSIEYFSIVFEAFKKEGRVVVFNIWVKSSLAHYSILSKQCVTILHIIGRALINKQLIYLIQYGISQKSIHSSTWRLKRFIAIVGASLEANQSWMTLIRFANYLHP